jgi:hypothetical protein
LEITGSSTTATAIQNTSTATITDSAQAATATSAGIVVEQDNGANALAQTGSAADGTEVKVAAAVTDAATLTISGTLNRATATGNTASTTVNETDFALNGTNAFSAARQQNTGAEVSAAGNKSVTATVNDTDINITSGATTDSSLTVSGSTDAAVATANSLTQRMTLDGTKLTLGTGSAALDTAPSGAADGIADVGATGKALLSSRQTNTFTDVSANNTASSITISAGVTDGSSLDLKTNVQGSTATGSAAANILAVSGTTVGRGVGIVSSQASDAESTVAAATTGKASITATSLGATKASSASLTDNALQSRATGGTVTNTLTAAATTITLDAADVTDSAVISRSVLKNDETLSGTVSGAYATLNDQLISGAVTATTNATSAADAGFTVSTGNVTNGSSINNDRNAMTAQAQGAVAANTTILAVGGTLSQGAAGTTEVANAAVIANIQELANGAAVSATVDTDADKSVYTNVVGVLTNSSTSTSSNMVQAFADGASATNALTASATTLTTPAGSTATPGSSDQTANAAFAVVNSQDSGTGAVNAKLQDSLTVQTVITGTVTASSVGSTGNVQEALAASNRAANSLALSATTLNSNGAILNNQDSDAPVTSTIGTAGADAGVVITTGAVGSSGIALTDNLVRSSAAGNVATNTQTIAATTLTLNSPDAASAATITALAGTVKGAFSTLSDQVTNGDVTATTRAGFNVSTGNVTDGSSINNDRNVMMAQAQGAVAANTTTLSVGGTLSQGTTVVGAIANAAVIANIQELSNNADVSARVDTGAAPSGKTSITGNLASSSVSTSNNKIQAFADGASATNVLTATATTLTADANTSATEATPPVDTSGVPGSTALTTDAAFAVINRQDGGSGNITAELNDPIPLRTEITGNTSSSKVNSTGNMQDAFATSNKASNSLALSATTLTTDGAVVNNQNSDAQVVVVVGGETSFAGGITQTAGSRDNNAGVIVDFNGTISNSAVAVTGNIVRGSAISNVGTNTLTASATTLSGDGRDANALADADGLVTNADFALSNSQTLDANAASVTGVFATYGVNVAPDQAVTNSQIAVSNNIQFGEALGNSATNRLQLTAVGAGVGVNDPTSAVNNVQSGLTAAIVATSNMELYANMASSASTIAIDGNSNTALGAVNNASNTLSVSGLTVDGNDTAASVDVNANTTSATFALSSNQNASGTLASTALTNAYNLDKTDVDTTATVGIQNGKASISNNKTTAEGSANRVANSLSVAATNSTATAAIGNEQTSDTAVTATASNSSYGVLLAADTTDSAPTGLGGAADVNYAAGGSSIALDGNATTALARGNSATNALNYTVDVAAAGYVLVATASTSTGGSASAGAAVLNAQTNTNNVAAVASSNTYSETLKAGVIGSLGSSQTSVDNNTTSADAFGNSGANSLTVAATDGSISAALNNVQSNTGTKTVSATASSNTYSLALTGVGAGWSANASSMSVEGNTTTAVARGNAATNTLNYTVGVAYSGFATGPTATVAGGAITGATGGAVILNDQTNAQTVSAEALNDSYTVALNAAGALGSALNSQVSLANNTTNALAFGNSATNTLTMATYRNGIPSSAIATNQVNSGAVTATATSIAYTITPTGNVSGSALRSSGNMTSAQAIGNSSVSTIGGGN